MSVKRAIDRAIDLGSTQISLSAKQHHVFCRKRKLARQGLTVLYRTARINQWEKK